MKEGIALAGSLLVDKINGIKEYPKKGELAEIISLDKSTGGLVANTGIDLKKIDKKLKVVAVGKVGNDEDGKFYRNAVKKSGLDVSGITLDEKCHTSFTTVMSIEGGERTFFTYAGACDNFGIDDVNFDNLDVKMLHLGYFLLLKKIDNGDGEKILKKAQQKGIKTSIDLVTSNTGDYSKVVPVLKYVDNLIVNEIEAGNLAKIEPKKENIYDICIKLKSLGVKERVIIHMPEAGYSYSDGILTKISSFALPKGYIKGTTGAGDAFCAGALYGIYNDYSDEEILEFASSCAAVSLSTKDATSGLNSKKEIEKACANFKRRED